MRPSLRDRRQVHRGPRVPVQSRREDRQPARRSLRRLDRGVAAAVTSLRRIPLRPRGGAASGERSSRARSALSAGGARKTGTRRRTAVLGVARARRRPTLPEHGLPPRAAVLRRPGATCRRAAGEHAEIPHPHLLTAAVRGRRHLRPITCAASGPSSRGGGRRVCHKYPTTAQASPETARSAGHRGS